MKNIGVFLLVLWTATVQADNHIVTIGYGGTLVFSPDEVAASIGDNIVFQFVAGVSHKSTKL
jgi:plastocyanin